ncbi:type 1 glutamine amidotransferase [Rubripirellula amarantea]|nr:type 1 glutamine amidotransferase [Rubripirellula amarantea]
MRVLVIQHTAVDSPGVVTNWMNQKQVEHTLLRLDRGDEIPFTFDADALMCFGGPQALHLPDLPTWVEQEKNLMRHFIENGRKVLGVCLGAQMLASALGAPTFRNAEPEVGWHKIEKVSGSSVFADLPDQAKVLHWHQNTFALPEGAVHLYQSKACVNQGFAMSDLAVGFQFHPEVTEQTIRYFLQVSGLVRKSGDYVQSREFIEKNTAENLGPMNRWFLDFLQSWLVR